eukprot:gene22801-63580_t
MEEAAPSPRAGDLPPLEAEVRRALVADFADAAAAPNIGGEGAPAAAGAGSLVGGDVLTNVLPEYVTVMVCNMRPRAHVEDALRDFLLDAAPRF